MQLRYVFTELRQGLRRNLSMHIAVVLTLFVSLTLVGLGVLLQQQADRAAKQWGNALQVTIYLCRSGDDNPACTSEVTDAQKQAIEKVVQDSPNVKSWHAESKDEAFAKVKQLFGKDRFSGPNAVISVNDMPESIWVTLKDPHKASVVEEAVVGLDGVSHLRDLRNTVGPILTGIDDLKWGAIGTAIALVIAALLLVANTIRLAAFARRREIGIMRLVGAGTLYIALPFLLESIVLAVVGSALAIGSLAAFQEIIVVRRLSSGLGSIPWIGWPEVGNAALVVAVLGPLLTIVPTLLLTRRYIKV